MIMKYYLQQQIYIYENICDNVIFDNLFLKYFIQIQESRA